MNISPHFDIVLGISRQGEAGKIVGTGYSSSGYILGCSQRLDISIFAALLIEFHLYIIDGPDRNPDPRSQNGDILGPVD